jgi:polyhydroxyalkanoate synthesis regulator phasin
MKGTQNDSHHPSIDTSKRTNDLAQKLTRLARIQASSLHSSASSIDAITSSGISTSAPPQIQDGLNEQILSFFSRVPALMKPLETHLPNKDAAFGLLKIAEQANKSLLPVQNFAIVERMFDAVLKLHARTVADQEESKATIQKLQSELARSKRDDLLRSWQDEAKRNAENSQAKIENMEQEIAYLKSASREFHAKVSALKHHRIPDAIIILSQESSLMLENNRLAEELRHARRQDSRGTTTADHNALEAKLMLADATIMRCLCMSWGHASAFCHSSVSQHARRNEARRSSIRH